MVLVKKELSEPVVYEALVGLTYPTDAKVIERLIAGEDVPWEERKLKTVAVGERVSDIPAVSAPWLLEQRMIREVKSGNG